MVLVVITILSGRGTRRKGEEGGGGLVTRYPRRRESRTYLGILYLSNLECH